MVLWSGPAIWKYNNYLEERIMKNKKFFKKLTFKKMTVADLSLGNMNEARGGGKTADCVYTINLPCTEVFTCSPYTCNPTVCGGICVS